MHIRSPFALVVSDEIIVVIRLNVSAFYRSIITIHKLHLIGVVMYNSALFIAGIFIMGVRMLDVIG